LRVEWCACRVVGWQWSRRIRSAGRLFAEDVVEHVVNLTDHNIDD